MIESSAIVSEESHVADSAYVGHFSIVGAPRSARRFGPGAFSERHVSHWEKGGSTVVEECVTISSHCVVGVGSVIGRHSFLGPGVHVGCGTRIGRGVEVYYRAQIFDRVTIGDDAWLAGFLCNDSSVGDRAVVFGDLIHRFVDATRGDPEAAPVVEAEAFIGKGAIVIGGVTIGRGAYVGAGAIVTADVGPGRLYLGNPARDAGVAPLAFGSLNDRYSPGLF